MTMSIMKRLLQVAATAVLCGTMVGPVQATPIVNEIQKLLASDGAAGDEFGISVALDGYTAIVGAYIDDDNGTNAGAAYVFHWDGSAWIQQAKLLASDGAAGDLFRIKIWDVVSGNVVYDNLMGAGDDADPNTAIGGGSIVIHTPKGR